MLAQSSEQKRGCGIVRYCRRIVSGIKAQAMLMGFLVPGREDANDGRGGAAQ